MIAYLNIVVSRGTGGILANSKGMGEKSPLDNAKEFGFWLKT